MNVVAVDVAIVAVEPAAPTLVAGESTRLEVVLQDGSGNRLKGRTVTWASSDAAVAGVDGEGNVIALDYGVARITAVAEGRSGEARVTVLNRPVARVEVAPDRLDLMVGQTATVRATTTAADGTVLTQRAIAFTVGDAAIASIDAAGTVTAVAPGSTQVLATSEGVAASATVVVARPGVETLEVSPSVLALRQGDTARVVATLRAADGTALPAPAPTWHSDNPAVAQVHLNGKVYAFSDGVARITVVSSTHQAHATVHVSALPVAVVEITPNTALLDVGATLQLRATLRADNGTMLSRPTSWTSSQPTTVTVDAFGRVTALSSGSATISAVSEGVEGQAQVSVIVPAVASVSVAPATATLNPGDVLQFSATLRQADGTILTARPVAWSTSDAGVIAVDAQGRGVAVAAGSASVTATAGGVAGTAAITVTQPVVPVASVTVQPGSATLAAGDILQLSAELRAADQTILTGRHVTWVSSDDAIAAVSAAGGVTAVKNGTATITATAEGVSGTSSITVTTPIVPVASVHVQPSSATLQPGEMLQLTAETRASDQTVLSGRAVTWRSSDASVVAVDATGNATAMTDGAATITATAEGVSGTAVLTVQTPPGPIAVDRVVVRPSFAIIEIGGVLQLQADVLAADGSLLQRTVTWHSSDDRIAVVDAAGRVTAKKKGGAIITAAVAGKSDAAAILVLR